MPRTIEIIWDQFDIPSRWFARYNDQNNKIFDLDVSLDCTDRDADIETLSELATYAAPDCMTVCTSDGVIKLLGKIIIDC